MDRGLGREEGLGARERQVERAAVREPDGRAAGEAGPHALSKE